MSSPPVHRNEVFPYYASNSGVNSDRGITHWKSDVVPGGKGGEAWRNWTWFEVTLFHHEKFWQHNPMGVLTDDPAGMRVNARTECREGRSPHHGELSQYWRHMDWYHRQLVKDSNHEVVYYTGRPIQLYIDQRIGDYQVFRDKLFWELEPYIAMRHFAKVTIAFDATHAEADDESGGWEIYGGENGFQNRVWLELEAMGINVMVEPSMRRVSTWSHHRDICMTADYFNAVGFNDGDTVKPGQELHADLTQYSGRVGIILTKHSDITTDKLSRFGGGEGASWNDVVRGIIDDPYGRFFVIAATDNTTIDFVEGGQNHAHVAWADEIRDPSELAEIAPVPGPIPADRRSYLSRQTLLVPR